MEYYIKSKNVVFVEGIAPATLWIKDGKINKVLDYDSKVNAQDFEEKYICPGFFDSHTHGFKGYSFTGTLHSEDLAMMMLNYNSCGVTNILASSSMNGYATVLSSLSKDLSLQIMGIHAEGPFLNDKRFGAAPPDIKFLRPSVELTKEMIAQSNNFLKVMTIAAEMPKAEQVIQCLKENNIKVAFGHSELTHKQYQTLKQEVDVITHLGNAMSGMHHRDVGLLGSALLSNVSAEIIADGNHVCKEMLEIMFKLKSLDEFIIVSDSTAMTGLNSGEYKLKSGNVKITEDGFIVNEYGHLSGSSKSILYGIQYLYKNFGFPLHKIINMASYNPAKVYQLENEIGSIEEGCFANFVILDSDLEVISTYHKGLEVYNGSKKGEINPQLQELLENEEFLNFYK